MSRIVVTTQDRPPYASPDTSIQEVILYCASRFRAYLTAPREVTEEWMTEGFNIEFVRLPRAVVHSLMDSLIGILSRLHRHGRHPRHHH
jgi:hypothetical protein